MSALIFYGRDGEIETLEETEKRIGRVNNVVVSIRRKAGTKTVWHVVLTPEVPGELTVTTANISDLIGVLKRARTEARWQQQKGEPSMSDPTRSYNPLSFPSWDTVEP